jgi:hypothetical protein
MTVSPIAKNAFSLLPYDTKLVIADFLDHSATLALNEALRRDERVYKKFPADYALKHALKTKRLHYETITVRLNLLLDCLDWGRSHEPTLAAIELTKVFKFLKDPVNAIIFMHLSNLKEQMIRMTERWIDNNMELYIFMPDSGDELRALAIETRDYITTIEFVRHVPTVGHQSVF